MRVIFDCTYLTVPQVTARDGQRDGEPKIDDDRFVRILPGHLSADSYVRVVSSPLLDTRAATVWGSVSSLRTKPVLLRPTTM